MNVRDSYQTRAINQNCKALRARRRPGTDLALLDRMKHIPASSTALNVKASMTALRGAERKLIGVVLNELNPTGVKRYA
jgi:hypothetical protein